MDDLPTEIISILTAEENIRIESILLVGSKLDEAETDFWSDTDLVMVLKRGEVINTAMLADLITKVGRLIAREESIATGTYLQRVVLQRRGKLERIDLEVCTHDNWASKAMQKEYQVLYGSETEKKVRRNQQPSEPTPRPSQAARIHGIWFLFYECVKKFMRDDNLIGLHLLMELIQAYLVLRMEERDEKYGTTVHRKGYGEILPPSIAFAGITYENKKGIVDYLGHLATEMDKQLKKQIDTYDSKLDVYKEYLQASIGNAEK